MASIEDINPKLAAAQCAARRIRDVMGGEDTIKAKRKCYLSPTRPDQDDGEYAMLLDNTYFFPATSRTAEGKRGLMFAKNVVLNAPTLEPIKNVITPQLDSWRDLAEHVVWETFQTNNTGLLVDHPNAPEGVELNAANAIELDYRPFIKVYPLEAFITQEPRNTGGRRTFGRVVLRETCDRVLELVIENGVYVQRVWTRPDDGGELVLSETRTPLMDGEPLKEIPFVVVSDNTEFWPQKSRLTDLANLNLAHYKLNGRIASVHLYASGMAATLTGVKFETDDNGNSVAPKLYTGVGGFLCFENPDAKATFMEPRGDTLEGLLKSRDDIQENMAKVGGNLIASDRNKAPESDNNALRRDAAENSATASLADVYARRISAALTWCSKWMGGGEAVLTLNEDYDMAGMTAPERVAAVQEVQSGLVSRFSYFKERQARGLVDSSVTFEDERSRIEQEQVDLPTTSAAPNPANL